MSDLEQVLNGSTEPPQPEPEEVKAEEQVEQETETLEEPGKVEAKADPEPEMVPVSVVAELRRELREAKRVLVQPQPQPKPAPDVIEDPDGYRAHMQEALSASITSTKLEMSRFMAEREFGSKVVEEAYAYFDDHPEESGALLKSASPYHAAVEHFNRVKVAKEIGSDPQAYAKKVEAEVRAKIEAEMVAKQARDKAGKFAPSMADVIGTGGGPKSNWTGPTPLTNVLGS
jgi:hypothetical protein